MRMIVRVLLLLTHLFILFYKEGIHMINFNIPPFTGKETEYMTKAIQNHKISGDGEFTKKCNKWIEDKTVAAQLASVFSLSAEDFSKIILAYEPVWAIGTGKTATPAQAQVIHAFIRSAVAEKYGKEIAENCSILYGGSCKPSNAKELFANPDVDGGLIGGAALKVADFKGIIDAFN